MLAEAERLETIDPEEQQDVLAEFRRLSRRPRGEAGAVEATFSDSVDIVGGGRGRLEPQSAAAERSPSPSHGGAMSDGDAAAMAELLAAEHPQIVAAALARLGEDQSAAVFAALPPEVQAQALERLAALAPADEDAVQEVETQLKTRLEQRRELQARAAAGADLVRKILARTPVAQRTYLLERMASRAAAPTAGGGDSSGTGERPARAVKTALAGANIDPVAQQAINLASAVRRAQADFGDEAPTLEDRSEALELLSDKSLVAALRSADESTVLRALAASGDALLARVTCMLPRRQAKQLRKLLSNLGPTRLADLHQAQYDLLRLADEHQAAEAA